MLGLIVFFVQTFAHVETNADRTLAFLAYFGATAIAIVSLGSLYLIGTREHKQTLTPQERNKGRKHAIVDLTQGSILLIAVAIELYFVNSISLVSTSYLGISMIVGRQIANRLNQRFAQIEEALLECLERWEALESRAR